MKVICLHYYKGGMLLPDNKLTTVIYLPNQEITLQTPEQFAYFNRASPGTFIEKKESPPKSETKKEEVKPKNISKRGRPKSTK